MKLIDNTVKMELTQEEAEIITDIRNMHPELKKTLLSLIAIWSNKDEDYYAKKFCLKSLTFSIYCILIQFYHVKILTEVFAPPF